VTLKYYENRPVLSEVRVVSKPSKRVYADIRTLKTALRGKDQYAWKGAAELGAVSILSTSKGIMSAEECIKKNIGGEVLAIAK